jgi:hypothetical protein
MVVIVVVRRVVDSGVAGHQRQQVRGVLLQYAVVIFCSVRNCELSPERHPVGAAGAVGVLHDYAFYSIYMLISIAANEE